MKTLSNILTKDFKHHVHGSTNIDIKRIVIDSRQVQKGDLFVAIRGSLSDGHNYIQSAIE